MAEIASIRQEGRAEEQQLATRPKASDDRLLVNSWRPLAESALGPGAALTHSLERVQLRLAAVQHASDDNFTIGGERPSCQGPTHLLLLPLPEIEKK